MIKKKQTLKIPTSYFQQRGVSLSYYTSRNHVWCFPLLVEIKQQQKKKKNLDPSKK